MVLRLHVAMPAMQPGEPGWPHLDYDYEGRAKFIKKLLQDGIAGAKVDVTIFRSVEEAKAWIPKNAKRYNGHVVFVTTLWPKISNVFLHSGLPVVIADDIYCGSSRILEACTLAAKTPNRMVPVASSDPADIVAAVRLLDVMNRVRGSKILAVVDNLDCCFCDKKHKASALEMFGIKTVTISSKKLKELIERVRDADAKKVRDRWIRGAKSVVEPSPDELMRSAKMHLALVKAMKDAGAEYSTMDCLGLYYGKKLLGYPCLSFFEQNNRGCAGICEADLDAAVTMILARHLTGSSGFLSDPVIDTSCNQIVYAHCVSTNKPFGPKGPANPYVLRSHSEDRKGASVQSLLPLGKLVTTFKVSLPGKALGLHQAKAVANLSEEKACRTKLACEFLEPGGAELVLRNYNYDLFDWHMVTSFGDFRKDLRNLAALYGLRFIEEDRR